MMTIKQKRCGCPQVRFGRNLQTTGSIVHAVVVKGNVKYTLPQNKEVKLLSAGSYFGSSAAASHTIEADEEAVIYIRTNGRVKVN